ncbi:hypothetical protein LXM94_25485 [Rhizobium sp. TRM95111]|uniref:hypothetical protein n=1 Tax=Rhizobium alarense TaxID=2846851 RepID=UPI001F424CB2|nr:hypothetical protein [Rhizobium alarense]MCF3643310.1 hypothetical protein [Rhizobium alarense]
MTIKTNKAEQLSYMRWRVRFCLTLLLVGIVLILAGALPKLLPALEWGPWWLRAAAMGAGLGFTAAGLAKFPVATSARTEE